MTSSTRPCPEPFQEVYFYWDVQRLFNDLALTVKRLTPTEELYLKGLLLGHKPKSIETQVQRKNSTVRGIASELYRYIEQLKDLEKNSVRWRNVPDELQDYRLASPKPLLADAMPQINPHLVQLEFAAGYDGSNDSRDWDNIPEVFELYDRKADLADLHQWLNQQRRVICITGSPGIGKTMLAAAFASKVRSQFDQVVWWSMCENSTLPVLLADLCRTLDTPDPFPSESSIEFRLHCLLQILQQSRILLVLDGVDCIYQEGSLQRAYRTGYENYGNFFHRLSATRHQSCIMLTAWEEPKELRRWGLGRSPVARKQLLGLPMPAAQQLLAAYELEGESRWDDLIRLYRGNPRCLTMAAEYILDVFPNGDVRKFMEADTVYLGDFVNLLHTQYVQLSRLEHAVLQHLAESACALVSREELHQSISLTHSCSLIDEAIVALRRRCLIEEVKKNGLIGYNLPPMVLKYIRNYAASYPA